MELNPNHPVTQELHDQWHKLLGLVMHKLNLPEIAITLDDINSLSAGYGGEMPTIVAQTKDEVIFLRLLPESEAVAFAARNQPRSKR